MISALNAKYGNTTVPRRLLEKPSVFMFHVVERRKRCCKLGEVNYYSGIHGCVQVRALLLHFVLQKLLCMVATSRIKCFKKIVKNHSLGTCTVPKLPY